MEELRSHRYWILFEGILFCLLGILAIALPGISTLSAELFIGWLFIFGGVYQLFRTFRSRHAPGFIGSLLLALLYLVFGVLLLIFPAAGILSLTLLLTGFFIAEGIAKIILGFELRSQKNWGWLIFNGLLAIGLAAIILSGWPGTAYWVLGLLVGINMLFFGATLTALALSVNKE